MTTIKLPGVKGYTSNGTPYYYLRASGERIVDPATREPIDPTREPERFAARVKAMKEQIAVPPPGTRAGTVLALIKEWRGHPGTDGRPKRDPSPEWQRLAPATKRSYERVIDPETGYLRRTIGQPLDAILLQAIDTPVVVKLRNKAGRKFGFWTGSYVVTVLSSMFKFGILYGHMATNPAKGVPDLERPEDMEQQHRPWADAEFTAMIELARAKGWNGIVLALGLGRFAGWPTGDIVHQPPSAWQSPRLVYVRRKTRRRKNVTSVLAPDPLRRLLEEFPPDLKAKSLVRNESGEPYTEDGLRTMVHRLAADLVKAGKVQPGLNIHGLRHSLGKELYDLGLEREARKKMMAHESDAASKIYERGGDGGKQADRAVRALNRKHKRAKTV